MPCFSGLSARVFPEQQNHGGNHVLHLLLTFWFSVFLCSCVLVFRDTLFPYLWVFRGIRWYLFGLPVYSGVPCGTGRLPRAAPKRLFLKIKVSRLQRSQNGKTYLLKSSRFSGTAFFNPCFLQALGLHWVMRTCFEPHSVLYPFPMSQILVAQLYTTRPCMAHHFNAIRANVSCSTAQTGIIVVSCCFDLGCETVELFGAVA